MSPEGMRPGRRLLIVDDEMKVCRTLADYFLSKGYEVRAVGRGEEALALVGVFEPEVVLLDLLLPGISGVDRMTSSALDSSLMTFHRVEITGLLPYKYYTFQVRSADGNGNLTVSGTAMFRTLR